MDTTLMIGPAIVLVLIGAAVSLDLLRRMRRAPKPVPARIRRETDAQMRARGAARRY